MNKKKGATLLELVMFIGIAVLILIGGIQWFSSASDGNKIKIESNNIPLIYAIIKNMYEQEDDYSTISNTIILKSSIFPDYMRVSGTDNIRHSWADDGIRITSFTQLLNMDSFSITYNKIPNEFCIDLTSRVFRQFDQVIVNGSVGTRVVDFESICNSTLNDISFVGR